MDVPGNGWSSGPAPYRGHLVWPVSVAESESDKGGMGMMDSLEISRLAVRYRKLTDILKKEGFNEEYETSERVTMMLVHRGLKAYQTEKEAAP